MNTPSKRKTTVTKRSSRFQMTSGIQPIKSAQINIHLINVALKNWELKREVINQNRKS